MKYVALKMCTLEGGITIASLLYAKIVQLKKAANLHEVNFTPLSQDPMVSLREILCMTKLTACSQLQSVNNHSITILQT